MSIVVLKLPAVKTSTETRPKTCPRCQGETFQRWGQVSKPVKDNRVDQVKVYRYRCTQCWRTFRHYPEGVDRADQTQRIGVDLGEGQPVAIGQLDEANPQAVRRFLQPLVQRLGVSVIVTDDLASFRKTAEKLDLEHQVCQFHVRRWVGRMLHELQDTMPKEWLWVLDEIKDLLAQLPPEGSRRLFALWKQIPERRMGQSGERSPLEMLRYLLIRLSEHWDSYRVFDWQPDVPWTNNGTEQVIGRMKMRSRTVRGYKSWQGMWAALLLAGSGIAF